MKAWGQPSNKPVLTTHGRMDNAGCFDRIIPLLPTNFYYICIDLPSHGKSTHFPPFFPLNFLKFVFAFKLVVDYFKRGKYILFGHSFGGGIGNYFARLYPEYVEKIICIDPTTPCVSPNKFKSYVTSKFNDHIKLYDKQIMGTRPTYSKEEALAKISRGRWGEPLPIEIAAVLANRVLEPAGKCVHNTKYVKISFECDTEKLELRF